MSTKKIENILTLKQTAEYLEKLQALGSVPGLDNIVELCRRLGNPQDALPFVHIAGTNGKGSILAYVSTIMTTAGYKVGRYISPAIFEYRERFQINGKTIASTEFRTLLTEIKSVCDEMVEEGLKSPTAFEVETALAFCYYKNNNCDVVILETGMGGILDATNLIMTTKVAVLSSISMDHMAFLGKTLQEIAAQKAGIVKPGCKVVSVKQDEKAEKILLEKSQKCGCDIRIADPKRTQKVKYGLEKQRFTYLSSSGKLYKDVEIPLAGMVQIENAETVIEVIEALQECGYVIPQKALLSGFLKTRWHGRFEVISKKPYFIIDGAHNQDAAKRLADAIRFYFTNKKIIYIMGILKDKEYEKVVAETYAYARQIITVTPPNNPRALQSHDLAVTVSEYNPNVTEAASLDEAVEIAYLMADKETVIIAFGSLSYLGKLSQLVANRREKYGRSGKSTGGH